MTSEVSFFSCIFMYIGHLCFTFWDFLFISVSHLMTWLFIFESFGSLYMLVLDVRKIRNLQSFCLTLYVLSAPKSISFAVCKFFYITESHLSIPFWATGALPWCLPMQISLSISIHFPLVVYREIIIWFLSWGLLMWCVIHFLKCTEPSIHLWNETDLIIVKFWCVLVCFF